MDSHQMIWNEKVAGKVIKNLEKRRMEGSYASTTAQAKEEVLSMIPNGAAVYRGGSMTAVGLGLWEAIAEIPKVRLIDPFKPEERWEREDVRMKGIDLEQPLFLFVDDGKTFVQYSYALQWKGSPQDKNAKVEIPEWTIYQIYSSE